mmetsp:Transcript_16946/g.22804  ORF Transcript_16946/g.22804 Transcript_16946/m.22804 type:complete len:222 (-) Transcript_16946:506-1171(-)
MLECLKTAVSIGGESITLFLLPDLDKALDGLESEALLLCSELAVLAHGVEADDVLLLLSAERVECDVLPLALLRDPLLARRNGLVSLGGQVLLPGFALLVLRLLSLLHVLPVVDGLGQRVVEKTAFVHERHSHETTQTRYALKVHAGLTHHLLHVEMLEPGHEIVVRHSLNAVLVYRGRDLTQTRVVFAKDVVSDADIGLEHGTLHIFVGFAGVNKLDHLG